MPKLGMEPIRRAETINAALDCFCDFGIEKTTLDLVAERAGFSKGIVVYYFKSKHLLVIECLKAFLKSYKMKITSGLTETMLPNQMLRQVVEVALPPVDQRCTEKINVSDLGGMDQICLPQEKIAKLFSLFLSKAANNDEMKEIMREVYAEDVRGIAELMAYAKKRNGDKEADEKENAYTLLALIYGLSFFRVAGFMPPGESENRQIALQYLDVLLGLND